MSVYEYEECNCHPWCSDPSRDEFIRAAEDGRSGPLPTLEEAIYRAGTFMPSEAPKGQNCTERDNCAAPAASVNSQGILDSSPAASGAAGTEVVEFWGVRAKQSMAVPPGCASPRRVQSQPFQVFASEREAQAEADRCGGVVFAIPGSEPAAPPASGAAGTGWLTGDERLAVSGAILILDQHGPTNIGRTLNDILARSSPPEVVLPECPYDGYTMLTAEYVWCKCVAVFTEALAAAGVKVKEVVK